MSDSFTNPPNNQPQEVPNSYDLDGLLDEINRLSQPPEMPRRVELCREALKLVKREDHPKQWASVHGRLASSLWQNPLGSLADNLEEAIKHYKLALSVYTRQAAPHEWAMTMNNLAIAYHNRIRGERAEANDTLPSENLEEAIKHYKLALEVYTPQSFPQGCRDIAYSLGRLLYDEGHFGEAREAFVTAHEAVEVLRGEMVREGSKQKLADENADLYARLVFCWGACQSGRTALGSGDEHVGLIQALMTAGTPSVVASLWSVNDTATRALFEAFYAEITKGQPPAAALREAAFNVRKRSGWEHPYYWGHLPSVD